MSDDSCPICWDSLNDAPVVLPGEELDVPSTGAHLAKVSVCCTGCGHLFHKHCILTYLLGEKYNTGVCPTCKVRISIRKTYPVYSFGSGSSGGGGDAAADNDCPICLDALNTLPAFKNEDKIVLPKSGSHLASANACCTSCGHAFHKQCLVQHLEKSTPQAGARKNAALSGLCPTCTTTVHIRDIYPMYLTTFPAPRSNPATEASMKRSLSGDSSTPSVPAKLMKIDSATSPATAATRASSAPPPPSSSLTLRPVTLVPPSIVAPTPSPVAGQAPSFAPLNPSTPPVFQTPTSFPRQAGTSSASSSNSPGNPGPVSPQPTNSGWSQWLPTRFRW